MSDLQPQARPMQIAAPPIRDKYFDREGNVVSMERIQSIAEQRGLTVEQTLILLRDRGAIR